MMPRWYTDIVPLAAGGDSGLPGPVLRGRMLGLLHGVFSGHPGAYAVAFPDSTLNDPLCRWMLRIFSSSEKETTALLETLHTIPWFRDYVRLSPPLAVPKDFNGGWISHKRFRIPSLSSDRHKGEQHGQLRQKRMEDASRKHLAYFIMHSKGNGSRFSLLIAREPGSAPETECLPNGYGFSVSERPFCLPELPWE